MPQTDAHVPGRTVLDEVIPARAGWSRVIEKDQILRVIDLEGRQAVDFICYSATTPMTMKTVTAPQTR